MEGSAAGLARGLPLETAAGPRPGLGRRVIELLVREPFVGLILAIEALLLCLRLPDYVRSDTWLTVAAGRLVAQHGPPRHDTLTAWAHGRTWVDQQWLGQLFFYWLHALGGLRLILLIHVLLLVVGFALALAFARRIGGSARSVAVVGIVALFVAIPNSVARTQSFAFLLFVGLFWLLASDARRPSARTFLVGPLLVVWANIHGSAVLGAGLVGLWTLSELVRAGRKPHVWNARVRALAIGTAAPLCLLVSPYSFSVVHYYRTVVGSVAFRDLVTEWHAATFPAQWPFFLLAVGSIWLAARNPRRLSLFEHLALICTMFAALDAVRNLVWFALVAVMVVPRSLDDLWAAGSAPLRRRVNLGLSTAALALMVAALAVAAGRPRSWYASDYSDKAAAAVSEAAGEDSSLRVFANEAFADWLLWKIPSLAGRVAFDARFELMTPAQLRSVVRFRQSSPDNSLAPAAGYRLLVLDPRNEKSAIRSVVAEAGTRSLYRDSDIAVLLRKASR